MNDWDPRFLVRSRLLVYQVLPDSEPSMFSHTRWLPAMRWVQPVGGQSYLYISYGKTKLFRSPRSSQPPDTYCGCPSGPSVETKIQPNWYSWYQRWPNTGSMCEYSPSPPKVDRQAIGPGSEDHNPTEVPLSWAPPIAAGDAEVAKLALIS